MHLPFAAKGNFPANVQDDLRALRDKLSLSEDATLNWKDFLADHIESEAYRKLASAPTG